VVDLLIVFISRKAASQQIKSFSIILTSVKGDVKYDLRAKIGSP
jgi:hypothetical protein